MGDSQEFQGLPKFGLGRTSSHPTGPSDNGDLPIALVRLAVDKYRIKTFIPHQSEMFVLEALSQYFGTVQSFLTSNLVHWLDSY